MASPLATTHPLGATVCLQEVGGGLRRGSQWEEPTPLRGAPQTPRGPMREKGLWGPSERSTSRQEAGQGDSSTEREGRAFTRHDPGTRARAGSMDAGPTLPAYVAPGYDRLPDAPQGQCSGQGQGSPGPGPGVPGWWGRGQYKAGIGPESPPHSLQPGRGRWCTPDTTQSWAASWLLETPQRPGTLRVQTAWLKAGRRGRWPKSPFRQ